MRRCMVAIFLFLLSSSAISFVLIDQAQARDFKVYGYNTPSQGEVELSYWVDYFARGNGDYQFFDKKVDKDGLWRHTIEAEYGITDRWTIAYYADFEKPRGEALEYVQSRAVFLRYRLFEPGQRFFDPTIYFEYYIPYHRFSENEKLEIRVILEKNIGPIQIKLNPIFDKHLSGGEVEEGLEFEYGAGIYIKGLGAIRPGLEFFGKMGEIGSLKSPDEQEHFIFPAVKIGLPRNFDVEFGVGFGLTRQSDDLVFKGIFSYAYE